MSITSRFLRRSSSLLLTTLALGLTLTANPTPATANEDEAFEPLTVHDACRPDSLMLHVSPSLGKTMFTYNDSYTGAEVEVEASDLIVSGIAEKDLVVRVHGHAGQLETSPDGEDTTVTPIRRGKVSVTLRSEADTEKGYLLVFLDDDGQELPSLPKVKVTTKPTCPSAPAKPPGFDDE